jgi:hypothetical protein
LKFEEKPDYSYLRKILKDLMYRSGFECDYQYDWVIKKQGGKIPESKAPLPKQDKTGDMINKAVMEAKATPMAPMEERKENRIGAGAAIMGGTAGGFNGRQAR